MVKKKSKFRHISILNKKYFFYSIKFSDPTGDSGWHTVEDIKKCGLRLNDPEVDSVMAVNTLYQHCCIANNPLNFDPGNAFEKTQDLEPIHCQTCAFFIWKTETFKNDYEKNSAGNFCGKFESYGLSTLESIDIDTEEDYLIAESLLIGKKDKFNFTYHKDVDKLIKDGIIKTN